MFLVGLPCRFCGFRWASSHLSKRVPCLCDSASDRIGLLQSSRLARYTQKPHSGIVTCYSNSEGEAVRLAILMRNDRFFGGVDRIRTHSVLLVGAVLLRVLVFAATLTGLFCCQQREISISVFSSVWRSGPGARYRDRAQVRCSRLLSLVRNDLHQLSQFSSKRIVC